METLHPEPGAAAGQRYERMTAVAAFRLAAAHTWPAAFCPAVFGIFWCLQRGIPLSPVQCVLLTAACILAQSSVNTLNDYVDYVGGTDSEDDNVEVNDAVLVYSHIDPKHALRLGIGYLLAAGICGVAAALHSGPVPYLIGLAGGCTVLAYSVSPIPVSALPLGEVISGFVMGVLIPLGIAAVGDGKFHPEMIPECLPLFLGIALIMLSNNGSDIEKDIPAGRRTLPTVLGREASLVLYRCMLGLWIGLLLIQPLICLRGAAGFPVGAVSFLLTVVLGRKPFGFLIRAKLLPTDRIRQMKSVTAANLIGNGLLAAAYAAAWLLGGM